MDAKVHHQLALVEGRKQERKTPPASAPSRNTIEDFFSPIFSATSSDRSQIDAGPTKHKKTKTTAKNRKIASAIPQVGPAGVPEMKIAVNATMAPVAPPIPTILVVALLVISNPKKATMNAEPKATTAPKSGAELADTTNPETRKLASAETPARQTKTTAIMQNNFFITHPLIVAIPVNTTCANGLPALFLTYY